MFYLWKELEHVERTTGTHLQYTSKHKANKTEQEAYMAHFISALLNF